MPIVKFVFLCLIFILASCGGGSSGSKSNATQYDDEHELGDLSYTVNAWPSMEDSGSVEGAGIYGYYDNVFLYAYPNQGYKFIEWESENSYNIREENTHSISKDNPYVFRVFEDVNITAVFKPCSEVMEEYDDITYSWSITEQEVTLTNNNDCNDVFVWAVSTTLCNGCANTINTVFQKVSPKQKIKLKSALPEYSSWKPVVVYTDIRGDTYTFDSSFNKSTSMLAGYKQEIFLIDFDDDLNDQLKYFVDAVTIDQWEDRYGDCDSFNWIDRGQGTFTVSSSVEKVEALCFVGNITGYN